LLASQIAWPPVNLTAHLSTCLPAYLLIRREHFLSAQVREQGSDASLPYREVKDDFKKIFKVHFPDRIDFILFLDLRATYSGKWMFPSIRSFD
jgi:hypothetical protein